MRPSLPTYALSIRQPWAWAIVNAGKDIENRQWRTNFRGKVCIHAAKGMTNAELVEFCDFFEGIIRPTYRGGSLIPHREDLYLGGIVGVAEIVDCVIESASPWFFGPAGFVLKNARPIPFIPVKGKLGFFKWEASE